jgi:hypothetical protein
MRWLPKPEKQLFAVIYDDNLQRITVLFRQVLLVVARTVPTIG